MPSRSTRVRSPRSSMRNAPGCQPRPDAQVPTEAAARHRRRRSPTSAATPPDAEIRRRTASSTAGSGTTRVRCDRAYSPTSPKSVGSPVVRDPRAFSKQGTPLSAEMPARSGTPTSGFDVSCCCRFRPEFSSTSPDAWRGRRSHPGRSSSEVADAAGAASKPIDERGRSNPRNQRSNVACRVS